MLCKAQKSGLLVRELELELELFRLQAIEAFFLVVVVVVEGGVQVVDSGPTLDRVCQAAENGHIIGLLREWIDPGASEAAV